LLAYGYNKQVSVWKSKEEIQCELEASAALAVKVCQTKIKMDESADRILVHVLKIRNILVGISNTFIPYLSSIPSKSKKPFQASDCMNVFKLFGDVESCQAQVEGNDNVLDYMGSHFQLDSDEEAHLFEEIDIMMDTQERAELFKGNTRKFLANSVECTFRRIFDLENAFRLVRNYLL
jgi:hypothetical protein